MRAFLELLPSLVLLALPCPAADVPSNGNPQTQVLKLDDEHCNLHTATIKPPYRILPSKKILIDASQYTFEMPTEARGNPLTEVLLTGGDTNANCVYKLAWEPGKTRYELSASTLQPLAACPAFSGFAIGGKWSMMISATCVVTNSPLTLALEVQHAQDGIKGAASTTKKNFVVWLGNIEVR